MYGYIDFRSTTRRRLLSDVRTATSTADNVIRRGAGRRHESPAPPPTPLCSDDDGARAAPSDRAYAVRQPRGRQPTAGHRRFLPRTPTNSPVRRHVSRQQLPEQDRRSFSRRHLFADGDESAHEASVESYVSESAFVKSEVDQEYRCDVESSKISSKSLHKPKFKSVKVRSMQSESCDNVSESELSDVVKLQPKSSARLRDKKEMRSKHAEAESDDDDVCTVAASRAVSTVMDKSVKMSKPVRRSVAVGSSSESSDSECHNRSCIAVKNVKFKQSKPKSASRSVAVGDSDSLCDDDCKVSAVRQKHACRSVAANDRSKHRKSGFRSKAKANRSSVASDESDDDNDDDMNKRAAAYRKPAVRRSAGKCDKIKHPKSGIYVRNHAGKKVLKKSDRDDADVNRKMSAKSKRGSANVRRRGSSFCSESESEADDKTCEVSKRRAFIKPVKFDGTVSSFATFKAQFENAAKFNKWTVDEQLAYLKASLTGSAAQCLWDQNPDSIDTLDKLWNLLANRFAGHNLTEKYRTELRNRRRQPDESLDALSQDIRLLIVDSRLARTVVDGA